MLNAHCAIGVTSFGTSGSGAFKCITFTNFDFSLVERITTLRTCVIVCVCVCVVMCPNSFRNLNFSIALLFAIAGMAFGSIMKAIMIANSALLVVFTIFDLKCFIDICYAR